MLQLSQLFSLKRENDVRVRLGKLPDDLEKAYGELYAAIINKPDSTPVVAERAFKWVMCYVRPLRAEELVATVRQDTTVEHLHEADIDIDFVLYACSNLLVVDLTSRVCGFSHLSVQEYLESRVWSVSHAHALAAKTCLVVLQAVASSGSTTVGRMADKDATVSSSDLEDADNKWVSFDGDNQQFLAIHIYAVKN